MYHRNKDVHIHNNQCVQNLGIPIALVEAKNTGSANKITEEQYSRLSLKIYLSMGSKIILMWNILNVGLSNRSVRIVKDMVCIDRSLLPTLPIFV